MGKREFKKIGQSSMGTGPFASWTWTKIAFYVFIFLVLVALGLSAWAVGHSYQNRTDFKLKTKFFSDTNPKNLYNVRCTNETLGNEIKTFSGTTEVVSVCPQSSNECSEFACGTDGFCTEQTIDGGECHSNAQCGVGSRCNLNTCNCTLTAINCTTSADCPIINFDACQEATCVSGTCSYNLTSGSTCASTTDCDQGFTCLSNCTCATVFIIQEYAPDFHNITSGLGDNPYFLNPPETLNAVFEDKGDWVEVSLEITTSIRDINLTDGIAFDFDLPVLANTDFTGIGTFVASSSTLDPIGAIVADGITTVQTSSLGRAFSPNANYDYTGPNENVTQFISVSLLYQKA